MARGLVVKISSRCRRDAVPMGSVMRECGVCSVEWRVWSGECGEWSVEREV